MAEPLFDRPRAYQALIAHFGPQGIIADGLRELGLLSGPLLTFFHAYDLTSAPRLAGAQMYRRLFSRGERLAAISQRGRRLLERLGAPSERVLVHHMGIDVERFSTSPKPDSTRPLRLLSVGRLAEKKGFALALTALAQVSDPTRFVYRIVGEGKQRPMLERLVRELDLGSRVTLLGARSQSGVRAELAEADVLIVPSITSRDGDEEGIPMVIMEALACRLAVVATRHGGIPELVEHEVTGLLTEERDTRGLATALERLASDDALRGALGSQGRLRVEHEFSLNKQLDQLEVLLESSKAET